MSKHAPPRNSQPEAPVDATAMGSEIDNQDPNYDYQFFSDDPKHPQFYRKALRRTRIGPDVHTAPWIFVNDDTDPNLEQRRPREDQTAGVDTAYRNGSMVLMKRPKKTGSEVYKRYMRQQSAERRAGLESSAVQYGGTKVSAGLSNDIEADINRTAGIDQPR